MWSTPSRAMNPRCIVAVLLILICCIEPCSSTDASMDPPSFEATLSALHWRLDQTRDKRFPSRIERVKLYMSNWYVPPCDVDGHMDGAAHYEYIHHDSDTKHQWMTVRVTEASNVVIEPSDTKVANTTSAAAPRTFTIESIVTPDKVLVLDRDTILECTRSEEDNKFKDRIHFRSNMRMYCADVAQLVLPAMDHVAWEGDPHPVMESSTRRRHLRLEGSTAASPILMQFGDLAHSHVYRFVRLPHLKKFRLAANRSEVARITRPECHSGPRFPLNYDASSNTVLQPIVWKLATHRHYGLLDQVAQNDIPWSEKKDMAVFRGQLTGSLGGGYNKHVSPEQNCFNLMRCRLVYNHANSTYVDARLTSTRKRLPNVLNGVELTTPSKPVQSLLAYKGIVMLEGNDVASGLKWALLSQSVVLMPIPRHTSWAMEELLVPWVHFVPLRDDASNVEAQMQWIVEHDAEAHAIAYASTLWMQDLVYHPDAAEDDRWIQEEVIRRYQRHFAAR